MLKEKQPRQHEFWLKRRSYSSENNPDKSNGIYRIALGDLMASTDRKTFPPNDLPYNPDFWNKTGTVGFVDISIKDELVPGDTEDLQSETVLVLSRIGIEPVYRRQGFGSRLIQRVEEIATKWDLNFVVVELIEDQRMIGLIGKRGYRLYHNGGIYAVKRLNTR